MRSYREPPEAEYGSKGADRTASAEEFTAAELSGRLLQSQSHGPLRGMYLFISARIHIFVRYPRFDANSVTSQTLIPEIITTVYCDCDALFSMIYHTSWA